MAASAEMLPPLRPSLSSAAAAPPWAMIYRFSEDGATSTGAASFSFAPAPSASRFSIPEEAYNLEERKANPDRNYINIHSTAVLAASGDGLLLLCTSRHRFWAHTKLDRPMEELVQEVVEKEYVRFVCNPTTGQLFRLPVFLDTETLSDATGLLTQADGAHGPPKRYAAVELIKFGAEDFLLSRFSSDTGKWDFLARPSPLPPGRSMHLNHEVLAFGGRLWWVDVSCGAVCVDPFSNRPELRHVSLPGDSVLPQQEGEEMCELIKYRRMGVSNGRMRYVEVSKEAPFQIRSFMLDQEGGQWTLEHQVSLDMDNGDDGAKERPLIAAIDPLNTDLLYLNMGSVVVVSVDMRQKKIIDQCSVLSSGIKPIYCGSNDFIPCVLPPFLGTSLIPGKKDTAETNTPADVLVRSNNSRIIEGFKITDVGALML